MPQALQAQTSLALSSPSASPGSSTTVNLSLTVGAGTGLAAIQWTLNFPAVITSPVVNPDPALAAEGKTLSCAGPPSAYNCIVSGLNTTLLANGNIATIPVTLPSSLTSLTIGISGVLGAAADGSAITVTSSGGTVGAQSGCTLSLGQTSVAPPASGGTGSVPFLFGAGCPWTAASNASWLTITSAASGTGSGTMSYTAAPNATTTSRSATVTIAGQTLTVSQAGNNPIPVPSLVSLNPFQGSGPTATLTLVYGHPNGWAAIQSAEFIINPRWEPTSRTGACYVKYAPGTGLFTLIADDGNSIAGTAAPGGGSLSNSQCTLNAGASSVSGNGTNLTVVAALTFQPTFGGQRHIWMQAVDYYNHSTNWLVYGVWFPTQTTVTAGPWYRIFDKNSQSYLYTADANEYSVLGAQGFLQQGISGLVMNGATTIGGISNIAWYRVYVNATNSHFWTSDRNEFLTLVNAQQAYVGEGVAAFVMPYINAVGQVSPQVTNTIPFYRAAFQGANLHFWTSNANEFFGTAGAHLPTGYLGEGIACYIFPASGAQFAGASVVSTPQAVTAEEPEDAPAVVSVVNSASYSSSGVVSPGQAISIYGHHLGGSVLWNGRPAEVVSASDNEIRVVVPGELAGEATLEVAHRGRHSKAVKLNVVQANPAIFGSNAFGRGNAQAQNQDGTMNGAANPAPRGSVVTLYTTGYSASGSPELPVSVRIAGQPAEVVWQHSSGTRAGVIELQVRVPSTVEPAPFQPVVLQVGNLFSQPGVGLAIQ